MSEFLKGHSILHLQFTIFSQKFKNFVGTFPGGGGIPIYLLYGEVPLVRVGFFAPSVFRQGIEFTRICPE